MRICSVISRRQLAHARVLARSLAEHHDDLIMSVLVVDDVDHRLKDGAEPFRLVRPQELKLEKGEFERLALSCDERQFHTTLLPRLLGTLLSSTSQPILYLAPTQRVYGSFVEGLGHGSQSILIKLRRSRPLPVDKRTPADKDVLSSGSVDPGLLLVTPGAEPFLDWWWQRLVDDALTYSPEARRLGQLYLRDPNRWLDLVPAYFEYTLLDEPGVSADFWNLDGTQLAMPENHPLLNGSRLHMVNFDGYEPETRHILSSHQGSKPRVLLSDFLVLKFLCDQYAGELRDNDHHVVSRLGYGFGELPGGLPIDRRMRQMYREALAQELLATEPPNPFSSEGEDRFIEWLMQPVAGQLVTRYLFALYSDRPDLQATFGDPTDAGFMEWVRMYGRAEEDVPPELIPGSNEPPPLRLRETDRRPRALVPGINVVGFTKAEVGLGAAARLLIDVLEDGDVPFGTIPLAHPFAPDEQEVPEDADKPLYDVNVICGTPDLAEAMIRRLGTEITANRYNVGFWFWEAQDFKASTLRGFSQVDEIWAPTRYVAEATRSVYGGPLQVFPVPVTEPKIDASATRASLGLPRGYLFLFVFDYSSVFERKNPLGLIEAYKRAFKPSEGAGLILKSMFADYHLISRERLFFAAEGRPDIVLLDGVWPERRKNALIALCDCYVSLHRSEGLGLTMAEAMALAKPTIATAYSGNLDFMDTDNSYLVRHDISKVGPGWEPYDPEWEWAEPDLDHAASLMRHVYENQDEANERGHKAHSQLLRTRSLGRAASFVNDRLRQIGSALSPFPAPSPPGIAAEERLTVPEVSGDVAPRTRRIEDKHKAERRARELIERGAEPSAPSRLGPLGRFMRRLVLFLLRPYDRHQREVQRAILEAFQAPSNQGKSRGSDESNER